MKKSSCGEKTTLRGTMATTAPSAMTVASEWFWWTWSWLCAWWLGVWLWSLDQWDRCYPYLHLAWMYITSSLVRGQKDEKSLLTWVQERVPSRTVKDLDRDLADGVALCGLMQTLVPGTCPRHDLLPPDQPAGNIRLASRLASTFLGVKQDLAWESMQGRDGHRNLMRFLRNLRYGTLRRGVLGGPAVTHDSVVEALGDYQVATNEPGMTVSLFRHGIRAVIPDCGKRSPSPLQVLARGMGLQMAMVGRRTKFTLYLNNCTTLDLVVEIKSEKGDYCSHRITHRSPIRSRVLSKPALKERHNIPLEYEVSGCEVRVAWIPLQEGRHTISIIWKGQHVVGSPYSVNVDDTQVSPGPKRQYLKPLIRGSGEGYHLDTHSDSCPVSESMGGQAQALRFMGILRRRVVRRVVHVGGEDVVLSPDESIGRSSQARQAFQRMRTTSNESFDENLFKWSRAYRGRRFSMPPAIDITPPPPSDQGKAEDPYLVSPPESTNWSPVGTLSNSPVLSVDLEDNQVEMRCTPHVRGRTQSEEDARRIGTEASPNVEEDVREAETCSTYSQSGCDASNESPGIMTPDERNIKMSKTHSEESMERLHVSEEAERTRSYSVSTEDEGREESTEDGRPDSREDYKSRRKKRERKKKSKGVSVNSAQQFGNRCNDIINMCDFIIEHSPKKDALRTLEVASHIINYKFNDVSESSYSLPTNSNEDNTVIDDDKEILETILDDQGNVVSVTLSSSDSDGGDITALNDEGHSRVYNELSPEDRLGYYSVEYHKEVVAEGQNEKEKSPEISENLSSSEMKIQVRSREEDQENLQLDAKDSSTDDLVYMKTNENTPVLPEKETCSHEPPPNSFSNIDENPEKTIPLTESLPIPDLVVSRDEEAQEEVDVSGAICGSYGEDGQMDYLQTIDEETEPSSIGEDDRWQLELDGPEDGLEQPDGYIQERSEHNNLCNLELSVESVNKTYDDGEVQRNILNNGDEILDTEQVIEESGLISEIIQDDATYDQRTVEHETLQKYEIEPDPEILNPLRQLDSEDILKNDKTASVQKDLPAVGNAVSVERFDMPKTLAQESQYGDQNVMKFDSPIKIQDKAQISKNPGSEDRKISRQVEDIPFTEKSELESVTLCKQSFTDNQPAAFCEMGEERIAFEKESLMDESIVNWTERDNTFEERQIIAVVTTHGSDKTENVKNDSSVAMENYKEGFYMAKEKMDSDREQKSVSSSPDRKNRLEPSPAHTGTLSSSGSLPPSPMSEEVAMLTSSSDVARAPVETANVEISVDAEEKDRYFIPIEIPKVDLSSMDQKDEGNEKALSAIVSTGSVSRYKALFEGKSVDEISIMQRENRVEENRNRYIDERSKVKPSTFKAVCVNVTPVQEIITNIESKEEITDIKLADFSNKDRENCEFKKLNKKPFIFNSSRIKEKDNVSQKPFTAPIISPDMGLLNQFRVDNGESGLRRSSLLKMQKERKSLSPEKSLYSSDRPASPVLQSLRTKSKKSSISRSRSLPYSTYVKPPSVNVETEKKVSQLRSVFESYNTNSQKIHRNFSLKSRRFITQASDEDDDDLMKPVTNTKMDLSNANATSYTKSDKCSITSGNSSIILHEESPLDQELTGNLSTTECHSRYKVIPEILVSQESVKTLSCGDCDVGNISDETKSLEETQPLAEENLEGKSDGDNPDGIYMELRDNQTVIPGDEFQTTNNESTTEKELCENREPERESELRKKSRKLVMALENMERDIQEMQQSVKRLNEHYPVSSSDEANAGTVASVDTPVCPGTELGLIVKRSFALMDYKESEENKKEILCSLDETPSFEIGKANHDSEFTLKNDITPDDHRANNVKLDDSSEQEKVKSTNDLYLVLGEPGDNVSHVETVKESEVPVCLQTIPRDEAAGVSIVPDNTIGCCILDVSGNQSLSSNPGLGPLHEDGSLSHMDLIADVQLLPNFQMERLNPESQSPNSSVYCDLPNEIDVDSNLGSTSAPASIVWEDPAQDLEEDVPIPCMSRPDSSLSIHQERDDCTEEKRSSPWSFFTAMKDYVRSRSASPLDRFVDETLAPAGLSSDEDEFISLDPSVTEGNVNKAEDIFSTRDEQCDTGKGEISLTLDYIKPPGSLLLHNINTPSMPGKFIQDEQSETTESLTSPIYEEANEYLLETPDAPPEMPLINLTIVKGTSPAEGVITDPFPAVDETLRNIPDINNMEISSDLKAFSEMSAEMVMFQSKQEIHNLYKRQAGIVRVYTDILDYTSQSEAAGETDKTSKNVCKALRVGHKASDLSLGHPRSEEHVRKNDIEVISVSSRISAVNENTHTVPGNLHECNIAAVSHIPEDNPFGSDISENNVSDDNASFSQISNDNASGFQISEDKPCCSKIMKGSTSCSQISEDKASDLVVGDASQRIDELLLFNEKRENTMINELCKEESLEVKLVEEEKEFSAGMNPSEEHIFYPSAPQEPRKNIDSGELPIGKQDEEAVIDRIVITPSEEEIRNSLTALVAINNKTLGKLSPTQFVQHAVPARTSPEEHLHESSCESDSDDDMRIGPIRSGIRPLVIPLSPSPTKSPLSTSDSDSQSESDVTTDEDEIDIPSKTPKAKYTKPARSHSSKLHTIPELSEDEEDVLPVRPPRPRRLSLGKKQFPENKGVDSPGCGSPFKRLGSPCSPRSPRASPDFPKFPNVQEEQSSEDDVFAMEDRPKPMKRMTMYPFECFSSSSGSEDSDDDSKKVYGRQYGSCFGPLKTQKEREKEIEDYGNFSEGMQHQESQEKILEGLKEDEGEKSVKGSKQQTSNTCAPKLLNLKFDEDVHEDTKYYPPLETLVIPEHTASDEEKQDNIDSQDLPLEEPEKHEESEPHSTYVITPLGEESILTENTFVPPMEMLHIPKLQVAPLTFEDIDIPLTPRNPQATCFHGPEKDVTVNVIDKSDTNLNLSAIDVNKNHAPTGKVVSSPTHDHVTETCVKDNNFHEDGKEKENIFEFGNNSDTRQILAEENFSQSAKEAIEARDKENNVINPSEEETDMTLTKEQLTFFQGGGLQQLARSMVVTNSPKKEEVKGDTDTEWMLQGRISPHSSEWPKTSPWQSPSRWPKRPDFSPRTSPTHQFTRVFGAPTDL